MISKKVCLIGSFATGKTSLVEQYVHSIFSDKYLSTIGVKISKKQMSVKSKDVMLMLWDMEGKDCFGVINTTYLRGASAFFLVVDCTRKETLLEALELRELVLTHCGNVPHYLLINKIDLDYLNEVTEQDKTMLKDAGISFVETSAKLNIGVHEAFAFLAEEMCGG